MARRNYAQVCGLAQALDLLGERWTLLIVRELMLGPKRFGALAASLPGLSANLLSARLRSLRDAGLVTQVDLPEPADGIQAYALTERGEALREPLGALALWGMDLLEPERQVEAGWEARGSWLAMTLLENARRRGRLAGLPQVDLNCDVGGERFVIGADGKGGGAVRHGVDRRAGAELSCDLAGFYGMLTGAEEGDSVVIHGDRKPARQLLGALEPPPELVGSAG